MIGDVILTIIAFAVNAVSLNAVLGFTPQAASYGLWSHVDGFAGNDVLESREAFLKIKVEGTFIEA